MQVFLGFFDNSAIVASSVYLNNLDLCSWVRERTPWFEPGRVFRWSFVEFRSDFCGIPLITTDPRTLLCNSSHVVLQFVMIVIYRVLCKLTFVFVSIPCYCSETNRNTGLGAEAYIKRVLKPLPNINLFHLCPPSYVISQCTGYCCLSRRAVFPGYQGTG